MDNDSASQKLVDDQVTKLTEAIQQLAKKSDGKLDIKNLADGVYSIYGTMVKVDKNTYSMSNEAINHTIKLTVKNGKYYITLNFNGLTVGQKLGYLSKLKYFTTGYTLDKYGTGIRSDYGRNQLWYRNTASISETGLEFIKSNNIR